MANQKLSLTRDQFASFLNDFEQIKQFERLFSTTNANVISIDDVNIAAGNAGQSANDALAQIIELSETLNKEPAPANISQLAVIETQLQALGITPPSSVGSVTSVAASGGSTGLTFSGSPITTSGTLTLGGTLAVASGGTGATTAAIAITNLGATTLGGNMFTLTNPSAITFPRFNADNTVSALDAASFRTAIGAGTGSGSVTSVSGTGTVSGITLTGTVTTSGSLTLGGTLSVTASNFSSQTANTFLAAPNGSAGVPTFRAIDAADVPTLNQNTTGTASNVTGTVAIANGGTGAITAPLARTSLGATTVGGNVFTLTNPSAITFPRFNADNTVSALDAATFRTAIGAGTSSTTGTVTSVSGTGTVNGITLTGTVTSSGSLTLGGTLSGVSLTTQVSGTLPIANGGTNGTTAPTAGAVPYGTGTAYAFTAAGTSGQVLTSAGAGVPTWTTPTTGTVTSVTGTAPVVSSGGAAPVISMAAATNLVNGYLTSTDWGTFNGKQSALVSGTNIKTVGGVSLLGAGDVGTIGAAYGGTGQSSYAVGDILYASATTTLSKLADVATGNALISGGVGVAPLYGKIGLTTHISGTLAVGNGGTGATTLTSGYLLKGNGTSAVSASVVYDNGTNIGIGTASPGSKLDVSSSSFNIVASRSTGSFAAFQRFAPTGQQVYDFYNINGVEAARISVDGANFMAFSTGSAAAERMRIDSTGLGIGVTNPQQLLALGNTTDQVGAGVSGAVTTVYFGTPSNIAGGIKRIAYDRAAGTLNFIGGSVATPVTQMTLDGANNLLCPGVYSATVGATNRDVFVDNTGLIGYVPSILASKTNITDIIDTSWLDALRPINFNYRKRNKDGVYTDESEAPLEYGLIAEEVEKVNPELVFYDETEHGLELRGVSYGKLMIPLLKEIQSLRARVALLEGK